MERVNALQVIKCVVVVGQVLSTHISYSNNSNHIFIMSLDASIYTSGNSKVHAFQKAQQAYLKGIMRYLRATEII